MDYAKFEILISFLALSSLATQCSLISVADAQRIPHYCSCLINAYLAFFPSAPKKKRRRRSRYDRESFFVRKIMVKFKLYVKHKTNLNYRYKTSTILGEFPHKTS